MPRRKMAAVTKDAREGTVMEEKRGAEIAFVVSLDGKWQRILPPREKREHLVMVHDESQQAAEDFAAKGATLHPTSPSGPYEMGILATKRIAS